MGHRAVTAYAPTKTCSSLPCSQRTSADWTTHAGAALRWQDGYTTILRGTSSGAGGGVASGGGSIAALSSLDAPRKRKWGIWRPEPQSRLRWWTEHVEVNSRAMEVAPVTTAALGTEAVVPSAAASPARCGSSTTTHPVLLCRYGSGKAATDDRVDH
jgi:hypothetical protein